MKEKRVRDGKKDRRWGNARVRRIEDESGFAVVSRIQRETKEGKYAVRTKDMSFAVFDPEQCLHVGRHSGAVGIIYRFKRLVWQPGQDKRDYSPSGERGLVPWEGGDWKSLVRAAADFAVRRAVGARPTVPAIVEKMSKAGVWGSLEFWKDLADRHALALKIKTIQDVMES